MEKTLPKDRVPSEEELMAYQESRHKYCDQLLPLLRKEAELARLQFEVDEFYLKRKMVLQRLAEAGAPDSPKATDPKDNK